TDYEVAGFCGAVSLLAVRHLSYDFLLLLPLMVAWRAPPFGPAQARWRQIAFWTLSVMLVLELPSWWRRVLEPLGAPAWLGLLRDGGGGLCGGVGVLLSWVFLTVGSRPRS